MSRRRPLRILFAPVLLAVVLTAGPAAAAPPASPPAGVVTPVLGSYWSDFVKHWSEKLRQQNGVIMLALGVGAVSLVIITRGKWKK